MGAVAMNVIAVGLFCAEAWVSLAFSESYLSSHMSEIPGRVDAGSQGYAGSQTAVKRAVLSSSCPFLLVRLVADLESQQLLSQKNQTELGTSRGPP